MLKKILFSLILFALFLSIPVSAFAKGPAKKNIDYVALGDSLAAGTTPYNEIDKGYADFLVERFVQSQYTVDFINFGVPGYTSTNVLHDMTKFEVQAKIREAEYVTIDIGANDILRLLNTPDKIPQALDEVSANLFGILGAIERLNPSAKVYVMGYYFPFPHLPEEQQQVLIPLLDRLNQVIETVAVLNNDTFIPTSKAIAKDYETFLPNPTNIHLSTEGYQIIAKEFWKKIDKSKNGN
ncbi:SGNH/GDSL hydrolase family protein [Fredinandcohnia sp. QZ13]|uniref:SGNH/GDSL hydrolase family protein n=1 Tax=Fredinandcohnia sp. QZ13 TaxID=3073144 RepID=UPI002852FEB2|nr:SGNH/GDSL hydrolase family protein [Fredinandcohnia sp. QZ13]MDR4888553.1 SGNH/GDSL hydrolase family protein [Fredinandcohnia sp. QZ13]